MGARRGYEYLAGLNDGREVWYGAERVNVAEDPTFAGSVAGMAAYFDYQWENQDDCLFPSPETGDQISVAHIRPRSADDIARRHRAFDRFARYSMGMLGRTPDYVNVVLAGHVSRTDIWEKASDPIYYERISNYQKYVAENDLALTHTIVHANIDKSIGELDGANAELTLQVVDRTDEGVIVRGAKMLATLGPIADECYVYPATPIRPGYEKYAISFAVPMNTPGVVVVCRDHYGVDQSVEDRPFSSRFDEQDGVVIFEDVLIPHDRVFIDGELDLYNSVNQGTATGCTQQQTAIRAAVKLEFAYDLLAEIAKTTGSESRPDIATMLGEVHGYLTMTRAIIHSAETRAHDWGGGAFFLHDDIGVLRTIMSEWMVRVNDVIKTIGSHNLLATPTQAAFDEPRLGPLLEKYLPGANNVSARERAQVFRTAWDFAGSALGSRIELYERFYLGSIGRARILEHQKAQRNGDSGAVRAFLEQARVSAGEFSGVSSE
ncbi:4-hydroxyphenylacetate 3-hydroxylase N-terminal domain-containing protein [Mycetocola zhadangensis]|uniref:Aromatic ring hydroxylase n=1 Tax=Mycetocola zhadangensis TaxID=1164595 RepID=A0A3L7IZX4_9MICO|nr:4-hydroxyphenylacetate 3-hydroxylase N-terminal domain-containing protein [Mycetocola zhadangensis]RLQ82592.1 aromatic ring hydroxylase [Mycetocola zhadangensis]GGF00014.1 4-hydroxyphenylacetate 3-monooxygenase oxygenase component [Mycetocola zhadangensis]